MAGGARNTGVKDMDLKDTALIILTTLIGGLFTFMWWDIRRRDKISNTRFNKKLYKEDGESVYLPRTECQKEQATYAKIIESKFETIQTMIQNLCKKVDQQAVDIKESNRMREDARKEWADIFRSHMIDR
ncbi:unnamed protein product [marine sediment metagenome]|uniref:Uncharacterized protein n=1 Tax=marine sediment metagenome TaxID=412755 RepID=X0U6G5_9ZZZZ